MPDSETAIGTSAGWCKDYNSAVTFLDPLFNGDNILESGNSNYAEIDDPELNKLIDDAIASPPGEEQTAAWQEANKYATESAVWVPWTWDNVTQLFSTRVVNAYYFSFTAGIDWVNVGIDETAGE